MNSVTLDIIVKIVVGVATTLITTFVIPVLVKWQANLKNSKFVKFIEQAVEAAEQLYGPTTGKIKKQYVIDLFNKTFPNALPVETLDALIESAVFEISQAIKNAKTKATEENLKKLDEPEKKEPTKIILG